jgi:signal transduction histidine kinase
VKRLHKQYVLVAVAIALALTGSGVATVALVAQDRSQQVSEAENEFQDDMDRALWRMETRLAAILARTLSQAPTYSQVEPQPFTGGDLQNDHVAQQDWIAEQSEDIQAAFVDGNPNVSNWVVDLDYGLNVPGPLTPVPVQEALLAGFEQFNPSVIVEQIEADNRGKSLNSTGGRGDKLRGKGRSQVEYGRRAQIVQNNNPLLHEGEKVLANAPAPVPVWHHDDGQTTLFLGRATVFGVEVFQLDWAKLEPELLGQAYDLFPEGRLVPMASSPVVPDETDSLLAGIPARYQTDRPTLIPRLSSQTRVTLVAMWALALLSLGGLVMGLRSAIAYGEQHRRFTSAVTHELRTPLTTFQMYSEMLSLGMVPEDRRAEYLSTLEVESKRLASLVENALAYARLEEGRRPAALEAISISGLLGQTVPALERLCGASGSTLEVHAPVPGRQLDAGRIVRTDPDAVLQVLTNLVDNACKYAFSSASNVLRLEVIEEPDSLHLAIADEGPGIPVKMQPHVFRPFDRAGRDESDPAPGVGLGLALSRDLARSLGGDLVLEPSRSGARFSLRLPF